MGSVGKGVGIELKQQYTIQYSDVQAFILCAFMLLHIIIQCLYKYYPVYIHIFFFFVWLSVVALCHVPFVVVFSMGGCMVHSRCVFTLFLPLYNFYYIIFYCYCFRRVGINISK